MFSELYPISQTPQHQDFVEKSLIILNTFDPKFGGFSMDPEGAGHVILVIRFPMDRCWRQETIYQITSKKPRAGGNPQHWLLVFPDLNEYLLEASFQVSCSSNSFKVQEKGKETIPL